MDDCDEEITILKKQVVELEVETYATKFLIKNLPMKLNGTEVRERNHDTQASVNEMLEVIEMSYFVAPLPRLEGPHINFYC